MPEKQTNFCFKFIRKNTIKNYVFEIFACLSSQVYHSEMSTGLMSTLKNNVYFNLTEQNSVGTSLVMFISHCGKQ